MWYDRGTDKLILSERNAERFGEELVGGIRTSFKNPRDVEGDYSLALVQVDTVSTAHVEGDYIKVNLTPQDVRAAAEQGSLELDGFTLMVESDEDHYADGVPVDRRSFDLLDEDEQAKYRKAYQ